MSHEENPPPGMTGLAGHGPMASIKCVAQNHGLPGVQALALVGTKVKSQQVQLFSAIGHLHGTGRTQEQPSLPD